MLVPLYSTSACVQVEPSQTQQPATALTQLELEALRKLRENLSAGAEKPLRAFTSVRDVFMDPADGAVSNSVSCPPMCF